MVGPSVKAVAWVLAAAAAAVAAASSVCAQRATDFTLSLRQIYRSGIKPVANIAGGEFVPFMERIEVDEATAASLDWVPDPRFDPSLDAGAPSARPFSRSNRQKGPLPFGASFEVSGRSTQVPSWSTLSTAAMARATAAESRSDRAGQEPLFLMNSESDDLDSQSTNDFIHFASGEKARLLHKDVIAPDHTDNKTVLALGQMAYNAYYEPEAPDWTPIPGWETSDGFGSSGDAIRGYVFTSPSYDVIAIVIKGTSLQTPFSGGPTSVNDKLNDNKMFSCCCGKAGWTWTPVCDCADNTATTCNVGCVERESDYKESYYRLATSIAHTVQQIFPRSAIWMTGHSLGGALASLVALTFDLPAFTYQTPGDLLFAKRLGLLPPTPPVPPPQNGSSQALGLDAWEPYLNTLPIYQFGNDGDPVFLGQCRSVTSSCWFGGYALETHCHVGKECVYDSDLDGKLPKPNQTSTDGRTALRKSLSINNHGIKYVIDRFLVPWEFAPDCRVNANYENCDDCDTWEWT